jgi:hypothetical protein
MRVSSPSRLMSRYRDSESTTSRPCELTPDAHAAMTDGQPQPARERSAIKDRRNSAHRSITSLLLLARETQIMICEANSSGSKTMSR